MAEFLENLWGSIFTPGPTPTLLIATNVTFACLQVTLFALLVATYSIHFVILSTLCGGLWVSINWFAKELQVAQAQAETEKEKQKQSQPGDKAADQKAAGGDAGTETDTETEVEGGLKDRRSLRVKKQRSATPVDSKATARESAEGLMKRSVKDLSGETSTDSEWEKVEGDR